jgi:cytoskeletal protein RodZ
MAPRHPEKDRPVLTGLLALVGVAVVIGLLGGLAVMVGVKATGLDGTTTASDESASPSTFNLPKPTDTGSSIPEPEDSVEPSPGAEESSEAPSEPISLTATQQSVSPMQQIDLTGTYQGGEGAVLQVQRFEGGAWSDFPVTASVSGGTFGTYVQTGNVGANRFRVIDTDSEAISNEVTVTVG